MANFTVNSANSLYQGTVDADVFLIQTAQGVTVNASAGDDIITAGAAGATTFASASFNGEGGNDTFNFNGRTAAYSATTINGGSGADTINFADVNAFSLVARGGDDVDIFNIGTGTFTNSTLGGGAADDRMSAANATFQGTRLQVGAGADVVSANVTSAAFLSSTVELGGGDDTLVLSATSISQSTVGGSDGLDTITVGAAGLQANGLVSIGGGAGADTLEIAGTIGVNIAAAFGTLQGGGGADTIIVSGINQTTGGQIYGGAGADSIAFRFMDSGAAAIASGGTINAASGMILSYSAFSDSTLGTNQGVGTMDVFSGSVSGGVGTASFMLAQSAVTFQSFISGNFSDGASVNGSGQYAFGNNAAALATLQSRVAAIDANLTTAGQAATFADVNNAQYIFVQGGTSGTTDDLLIRVNGFDNGSVALGNTNNNTIKVIGID